MAALRSIHVVHVLAAWAALVAGAGAARSQACVTCKAPDATYRCAFEGEPLTAAPDARIQLLCIKEIATRGNHQSCSINRTKTDGCSGPLVLVAKSPQAPSAADGEPPSTTGAAPEPVTAAAASPKAGPPETVEALAKDAAKTAKSDWEKTQTQMKDGTKAVGGAFKKSWDCVVSLFARC
jgi:hypothetical protein